MATRNEHSPLIDYYALSTNSDHPEVPKVKDFRQWSEILVKENAVCEFGEFLFEDGTVYRFSVIGLDLDELRTLKNPAAYGGIDRELVLPDGRVLKD